MPFAKTSVSEAVPRLGVVSIPSVALDEDLDDELDDDLDGDLPRLLNTKGALPAAGFGLRDLTTGALPRLGDRLPDPVELVRLADLDALCFEPRDCGA